VFNFMNRNSAQRWHGECQRCSEWLGNEAWLLVSARRRRTMMYALVWEFRVNREREAAFRRVYGAEGDWARLFRRSAGYLGSELLEGESGGDERRYLTIDRWASRENFESFHGAWQDEYRALDKACEALTVEETFRGAYSAVAE
jgi:heme-degrading monooxygenase HmoA